jgi:predicted secreted Zn-dependent protease
MAPSRWIGPLLCALAVVVAGGIPVRATPDVPVFVGPASLELEGTGGAWRWRDVRFGTDEVRAHATLVPAGASCSVRLRVMAGGERVAGASFHASPGTHLGTGPLLRVAHVHGGLRIDSDCRDWLVQLEPLPDRHLAAGIEERSYPVHGERLGELTGQLEQVKGRWAAYSRWHTSWNFTAQRAEDGSACTVMAGDATVEVSLTLPDWRKPARVEPAVEARWQAFVERLRVHELGHVTIALQGADAIEGRLDAGFRAASCKRVGQQADAAARRIFERYARATRRYDRQTEHGLSQGTGRW